MFSTPKSFDKSILVRHGLIINVIHFFQVFYRGKTNVIKIMELLKSRKKLPRMRPSVNFTNIFTYKFFVQMLFWQLFLVTFWLRQKIRTKKRPQKMLMKLKVDVQSFHTFTCQTHQRQNKDKDSII
jgi:hypothetical protein